MDGKSLIIFLLIGLVAGWLASFIVGGGGLIRYLLTGVVGSFVGGFIFAIFTDDKILDPNPTGIIGSVIGAIVALLIWRRVGPNRQAASSTEPPS